MDKITVDMYGHEVEIPRGDMTDEQWKKFVKKTEDLKLRRREEDAAQFGKTATDEQLDMNREAQFNMRNEISDYNYKNSPLQKQVKSDVEQAAKDAGVKVDIGEVTLKPSTQLEIGEPTLTKRDTRREGNYPAMPQPQDRSETGKRRGIAGLVQQGMNQATLQALPDEGGYVNGLDRMPERRDRGAVAAPVEPDQETPSIPGEQRRTFPAGKATPMTEQETVSFFGDSKSHPPETPFLDAMGRIVAPEPVGPEMVTPGGRTAAGPMPDVKNQMMMPPSPLTVASRAAGELVAPLAGPARSLGQWWSQTPEGKAMMGARAPNAPPPTVVNPAGIPGSGKPSVPPPGGAGGMASSASMRATVPGGGALPEQPDHNPEIDAAVRDQVAAARGMAEVQTERDKAMYNVMQSAQDFDAKMMKDMRDQDEAVNARIDQVYGNMMDMQKVIQDPSKTPDPERYWKSHSKVLFAIGVGMMAARGKDISSVLQSTNQAIDRDIDAQIREFESPKRAARESFEAGKNLYGMLRSRKLDAYESKQVERAIAKEFYANQIEQMARLSPERFNQEAANQLAGRLREDATKIKADLEIHSRANAIAEYRARTDRFEMEQRYSQRPAGGLNKKKLTSEEQKQLEFSEHGRETIRRIKALLGPVQSLPAAMKDEIMKRFPLAMTDAKERARAVEAEKTILATDLAKSSLQAHEQQRWLGEGGLLGGVGIDNQSQRGLDELFMLFGDSIGRITGVPQQGAQGPLPSERRIR